MRMDFIYNDLGQRKKGEIIEVTLTAAANVRLMDTTNYSNYKNGRQHRYYGGLVRQSPFRIAIPNSGHWYITVDMQGLVGNVRASFRLLPSPLPEVRNVALSSIPSLVRDISEQKMLGNETYDVFISHASEDKDEIVRDLAEALKDEGLTVWYDEFTLHIGDSLRRKIDHGLKNSRVGLVVLSPFFINKGWTNYELDGIITLANSGEQILLPIWHNLTKQQVMDYSPSLADKVARSTGTHTVMEIAQEISELLRNS